MKPIRLVTIGNVIWFILVVSAIVGLVSLLSMFKKEEPEKPDKIVEPDSELIIDYTNSKNYVFDFEKNSGFKSENDVITIKDSGTYKLQGKNEKNKFVIDSPGGVIKLVFSNFDTSVVYDLFNIKNAYKIIIELEDGSENSIVSDLLEQENVANPNLITSNSDIEFIGNGKLKVETIGNFLISKANLDIKDVSLEINSINKGLNIDGNINMASGNLYIFSSEDGIIADGNLIVDGGNFVIRSSTKALKVNGIFLVNKGKIFLSSLDEIQKPNANSLQKTIILNFKEARDKLLFFHDTAKVVLVYAGGLKYQHILYSDDFESQSYVLYGSGKVAGTQTYGLYEPEDCAEEGQLTCEGLTNDRFTVEELVNVYEDIVNK